MEPDENITREGGRKEAVQGAEARAQLPHAGIDWPLKEMTAPNALRSVQAFRCLFTSFVISNMFTWPLPPNTGFSVSSALIMRLFFLSCRPFFLM